MLKIYPSTPRERFFQTFTFSKRAVSNELYMLMTTIQLKVTALIPKPNVTIH